MDKQSPKIFIKVNGEKTEYMEQTEKTTPPKEEFPWILPEEEPSAYSNVVPFRPETAPKPPAKKTGTGKQILLTIGAAVVLGTGFGVGMLQLLNGGQTAPAAPAAATPAATAQQSPAQGTAALQNLQLHMVQGGVYTKKENGEAALADAKAKGLPGYLAAEAGKYRLFIGIMGDKAAADKRRTEVQGAYKEWTIPSAALPSAYAAYTETVSKGESLLAGVIQQASLVYSSGKSDSKQKQALKQGVQAVVKESGTAKQENVKRFLTYVSLSYDALEDYEKKPDEAGFTKLQQLLFEGVAAYQNLLSGA